MFVGICKVCGYATYAKSLKALKRNMLMHYARHACEELMLKYSVTRGTCVKKVFERFKEGVDFGKYFDVREVK
jgi:hypothetical protein